MSSKAKLHARRRAARFGDLDALLAEALRDQRRGEGAVKKLKGINQAIHETYANPLNWDQTGVVQIIHTDERTSKHTTIGTFQEFTHRRTAAMKLTRIEIAETELLTRVAYSPDPFLLGPPQPLCPPVAKGNVFEQQAIRDYLARNKDQRLDEFLGSKTDAQRLLGELSKMGAGR